MIHWFYQGNYELGTKDSNVTVDDAVEPLIAHLDVYAIADKYDIVLLKALAKLKFSAVIDGRRIRGDHYWIQTRFPKVIERVYDNTEASDYELRDWVLVMLKTYWDYLRDQEELMDMIRSNADLVFDIMDAWSGRRRLFVICGPPADLHTVTHPSGLLRLRSWD